MEREIRIMDVQPTNMQQLCDAILSKWTKISEECFQHIVESMPRRIKAVLKAKGVQPSTSKVYLIKWPVSVYIYLYYGAVKCLNLIGWRTFGGVQLFSGKRMANVVPGSSLDRITVPYHFAKLFLLFQRSYNRKITKISLTDTYSLHTP